MYHIYCALLIVLQFFFFLGLLKPPSSYQPVNYRPMAAHKGRNLFVVSEFFELFHFDLVTNIWSRLSSTNIMSDHEKQRRCNTTNINPPTNLSSMSDKERSPQCLKTRKGSTLVICDKTLYLVGGEGENNNGNRNLFISYYDLPKKLDWSMERLLWLACFKNNISRDKCFLSQCPPVVMYKIISYVNSDIFML